MAIPGHTLVMHVTNSGARVPCCSCGWYGAPHVVPRLWGNMKGQKLKASKPRPDVAEADARQEHRAHLIGVELAVHGAAAAHAAAMADLAFRRRHP